ncbi:MAG TPA: choice-of-anchor D domain-containing protein, partial [Bryobacteraceae bacterium]|nr:choice-of-anchor D domain-containing protein [Bryobacteraceae bacterium]
MRYLALFFAASSLCAATYNCSITTLANNNSGAIAQGYNNAGTISGFYVSNQAYVGFVQNPSLGNFTSVVYPGGANTRLYGINNNGVAVGDQFFSGGTTGYFTWDSTTGNFTPVTVPSQYHLHGVSGINDSGAISAVITDTTDSSASQANAIINPDGSVTPIPGPSFQPGALNNSLEMVQDGNPPQLNNSSGSVIVINYPGYYQPGVPYNVQGSALNNAGVFAGSISGGFLFDSGSGVYSEFFCPGMSRGQYGSWVAINDSGGVITPFGIIGTPLPGQSQTALSSAGINFPAQQVGQPSNPQTVTITNTGNQRLDIGLIRFGINNNMTVGETGCPPPPGSNNGSPASLDPGASCTVTITATPTVTGQQSTLLYIDDTSPGSPHTIPVTVTGNPPNPPTCTVSDTNPGPPASVEFTMSDVVYGLRSVQLMQSTNATATIPPIFPNTSPVVVNAQQITPGQASSVQFVAVNNAGGSTTCGSNFAAAGGGSVSWIGLNGTIAGKPAVASNQGGYLEVVARDLSNQVDDIDQKTANGSWFGWRSLGGYIAGNPALIQNTDGRLAAFARGTDNALWYAEQFSPGGTWSPWSSLGGALGSDPVAAVNADGTLDVFVLGTDNTVWHIAQTSPDGAWGSWSGINAVVSGLPAVVRNQDGRLEIFARGNDNTLVHAWQTSPGGDWSASSSLGGYMIGNPAAAVNADGRVQAFALGGDSSLWTIAQSAAGSSVWGNWSGLGGTITADPAVAVNTDGRIEAFVRGSDDALWHMAQTSAGSPSWSGWTTLQGSF